MRSDRKNRALLRTNEGWKRKKNLGCYTNTSNKTLNTIKGFLSQKNKKNKTSKEILLIHNLMSHPMHIGLHYRFIAN